MKTKYWILTLMLIIPAAHAQDAAEGNDGPHGGFAYQYTTERLRSAVEQLAPYVPQFPEEILARYGVDRNDLAEAIAPGEVRERSRANVVRGGRLLELNYRSSPRCRIIVLEPFFQLYEPRRTEPATGIEREIHGKLIHEASHCSGASEETATQFTTELMAWLYVPRSPSADPLSHFQSGIYEPARGGCAISLLRDERGWIRFEWVNSSRTRRPCSRDYRGSSMMLTPDTCTEGWCTQTMIVHEEASDYYTNPLPIMTPASLRDLANGTTHRERDVPVQYTVRPNGEDSIELRGRRTTVTYTRRSN